MSAFISVGISETEFERSCGPSLMETDSTLEGLYAAKLALVPVFYVIKLVYRKKGQD